jgi:hypothetical protein
MRELIKSPKKQPNLPLDKSKIKHDFVSIQGKITFRCDTFLLDRIKNMLTSQHLAGNYQYPNLSYFFRSALHAYQHGMALTYQRKNNPRKEVSFRLTEDLFAFYNSLPPRSKAAILERALGSCYQKLV